MSDFDQFTSAEQPPATEEDPAAAFLAREQDELAELEQDNFADDQLPPQNQTEQVSDNYGGMAQEEDFFGGGQTQAPVAVEPTAAAVDDMFDPLGDAPPAETDVVNDDMGFAQEPADPYASIKQVDRVRQEPEKIKKWREDQAERLEKKDAASGLKEGEWREIAKKELEDWYKHRAEQFEKTKKTNRETEDVFIQERDESLPGDEWERICRHCDFNPKAQRNTKDISRMRSILLQLKQNPVQRQT